MIKLLVIGLGGFVGAIARYGISALAHRHWSSSFPYGTLAVNVLGCLLIGSFLYLIEDRAALGSNVRLFVTIGLLGAFTTFSTFGYETLVLLEDGRFPFAALNVTGNVLLGLSAVWLGRTGLRALGL